MGIKISELAEAAELTSEDLLEIVQGGANKKLQAAALLAFLQQAGVGEGTWAAMTDKPEVLERLVELSSGHGIRRIFRTDVDGVLQSVFMSDNAASMASMGYAEMRTALGVQAADATLDALAGLALAADCLIYATGEDALAVTPLTEFARTLLGDTTAAEARATLGIDSTGSGGSSESWTSWTSNITSGGFLTVAYNGSLVFVEFFDGAGLLESGGTMYTLETAMPDTVAQVLLSVAVEQQAPGIARFNLLGGSNETAIASSMLEVEPGSIYLSLSAVTVSASAPAGWYGSFTRSYGASVS